MQRTLCCFVFPGSFVSVISATAYRPEVPLAVVPKQTPQLHSCRGYNHVMFLAMEAVRRQPVSLRTRQIATYMGLAFIVVLMMFVIKNDIERPW